MHTISYNLLTRVGTYTLSRFLVIALFFIIAPVISYAVNIETAKIDSPVIAPAPALVSASVKSQDTIISVKSLGTQPDSAKLKQVIAIRISSAKDAEIFSTLYVDGIAMPKLKPWKINAGDKILFFPLNTDVQEVLLNFLQSSPFEKSVIPVYFSVGTPKQALVNNKIPIYVEVRQRIATWWIWLAAVVLIVLAIASLKYNILKDDNNLYYSLGRTQLFFWTLLVLSAYIMICLKTDTIPDLPLSVLGILSISVSTTAVSKLIENKNKAGIPIDKNAKSEGFFLDILSDGSSINIQRFQNVAFNLFFGVVFLQKAFANHIMPDFDQNVLILMGISAGTYAGLKNTEATKEQSEPAKQTGDDIQAPPPGPSPADAGGTPAPATQPAGGATTENPS
jgi:hypothetical protein